MEFTDRFPGTHEYVLAMMGYPMVAVEIPCRSVEIAVEQAIKKWIQYQGYDNMVHQFEVSPGKNGYDLSNVMNNLNDDIIEVYYDASHINYSDDSVYLLINQYYYYFRASSKQLMSDYYLFKGYIEDMKRNLGTEGSYKVIDDKLWLFPAPSKVGKVAVLYRCPPSDGYVDQNEWIRRYSLAIVKGMLGQARGKFSSGIMGPGGVINFNASELNSQSTSEQTELLKELRMRAKPVDIIIG